MIVAPSTRPKSRELFFIRAGQLVRQLTATAATRRSTIERALQAAFAPRSPQPVTREIVDEMHLLDGWLRRHTERLAHIPVDPTEPAAALGAVMESLRAPVAPKTRRRASVAV